MATRLIELVEKMPGRRVALVGDFMLDRYVFGRTERISPEGPIPVLKFHHEEQRLGGAGFVQAGLAALGAQVSVVGVVGHDSYAQEMRQRLTETGANIDGLIVRWPDGQREAWDKIHADQIVTERQGTGRPVSDQG